MQSKNSICALIMAAGDASRMGGKPKQFLEICNKSVLIRTLSAFERTERVDSIVVVTKNDFFDEITREAKANSITKFKFCVCGGNSRMESVLCGMNAVGNCDFVLVHDCARPLVSKDTVNRVIDAMINNGAAICAVPIKDTVKFVAKDGFVEATPDRSSVWCVQTPQGFKTEMLKSALEAVNDLSKYTDDSSVVEASGHKVYTVMGDYTNIKITTPDDIITAEQILRARGEAK